MASVIKPQAYCNARISIGCLALMWITWSTVAHALPWDTDMYWQPALEEGTSLRRPATDAVPTTGIEPPIPRRITDRIKAGLRLRNPTKSTEQSITSGKRLFGLYCSMCHGTEGKGDGPMVGKVMPSSDLHANRIKRQKDGYLYATIRSGGLVMPGYGHALSQTERWDLVNYIRHLQKHSQ